MVDLVPARMLVCPILNRLEHIPLDFDAVVTKGRVVKGSQDIVNHLVDWNVRVFPREQDTT